MATGILPECGEVLGGRYALGPIIGTGGMAVVREAVDLRLGRPVAVKMLGTAGDERSRHAAAVEMRALATFDHPNLVRLLDADVEDGRAYLVMELVDGSNLAERLEQGRVPEGEVRHLARAMTNALAYVHAHGVVHRDVKPANVLLGRHSRVLLADFGIAQLVDMGGVTATGLVAGTPAYLAPEQVTGERTGPQADVFALGIVLAECLSGRRACTGSPAEMVAARLRGDLELPPGIPPRWVGVLSAMTRRDPATRPTAADLFDSFSATDSAWTPGGPEADTAVFSIVPAPAGRTSPTHRPLSAAFPFGPDVPVTTELERLPTGYGRIARAPRPRWIALATACALAAVGIASAGWGSGPSHPSVHHSETATTLHRRARSTVAPAVTSLRGINQLVETTSSPSTTTPPPATVPPTTAPPGPGPGATPPPATVPPTTAPPGPGPGKQGGPGKQSGPGPPGGGPGPPRGGKGPGQHGQHPPNPPGPSAGTVLS